MSETDLQRLSERGPDRPLDGLEADVWAQVDVRKTARRAHGVVVMWQAGTVALALLGAVALGSAAAKTAAARSEFDAFSPTTGLAPSTLLMGRKT